MSDPDNTIRLQERRMLIGIGVMRCGTTSLHRYLFSHPALSMARKELNFFVAEKNWKQGLKWFDGRFDQNKPVWGDFSVAYTKRPLHPESAQLIHRTFPRATLVILVRNPFERIVSHFRYNIYKGWETRSFAESMKELNNNYYVKMSQYHYLLTPYIELYDRSQILLFEISELAQDPLRVCREIFKKLDIDPEFHPSKLNRLYNTSANKRSPGPIGLKILSSDTGHFIRQATSMLVGKRIDQPVMDVELKDRLSTHLRPDIQALEKWSGRDFSHFWR